MTPESWTIALRGAVVAALSFTPLALAAAAAAGWFRGGSATADTGALLLLAPLVLGILLTVIATGAVLAALAGAAAAVLASRPGGTVPSIGLALVAGIVGAAIGASSSFAGTDTLQGAHPGVVGAVLWGLPVLLAALTVRTRPSDAPVRRKPAPRPVPAASPATPSVPTNPSVGAGGVPASPGPIDSAVGTTTNRTIPPPRWPVGRRPAQRAPLLQGRTVPLVVLSAGGAAITGGLLMASPDLALGTPLGWCLQPWLALGTAGMFDADRLIDPTRIVLAGAVGAAINLPLAYLGAVALSRRR